MFADKVVLITGSTRGIGNETALKFAAAGFRVVVTYYRNQLEGEQVQQECLRSGAPNVLLLKLDVADSESVRQAVSQIIQAFGRIDILVNNAGILVHKYLQEQSLEDIRRQLQTNLEGVIAMTKACLPYIKECIINVGSTAALRGHKNQTVYAATKFGVRGFTQSLARELPQIRVYVVNPGMVATRMTEFRGISAGLVAAIIYNAAVGKYQVPSGGDINIQDYLSGSPAGYLRSLFNWFKMKG